MKTYLPYTFKKIGILFVFVAIVLSCTGGIDDIRQGFVDGSHDARYGSTELESQSKQHPRIIVESYFTDEEENTYIWISLLFSITGFITYLFSKEKVDDEYIQQQRLKSIFQSLLATWIIYGVVKLLLSEIQMDGIYILQLQLLIYVIIFRFNKNSELSEEKIALED